MNIKRWFAWMCLVMMLIAEIFLFQANRQKDAALTSLREAQVKLHEMQDDLQALKNSDVGLQQNEINRLRRQNNLMTNQLVAVEASLAELQLENESNAQHLATARLAIQMQQQHLEELQDQNVQIQDYAEASATNAAAIIAQKSCLSNLRRIDDAKQQWASDNNAAASAVPKVADLLPYLKGGVFPVCPSGGKYSINAVNEVPTCSYPGHVLRE